MACVVVAVEVAIDVGVVVVVEMDVVVTVGAAVGAMVVVAIVVLVGAVVAVVIVVGTAVVLTYVTTSAKFETNVSFWLTTTVIGESRMSPATSSASLRRSIVWSNAAETTMLTPSRRRRRRVVPAAIGRCRHQVPHELVRNDNTFACIQTHLRSEKRAISHVWKGTHYDATTCSIVIVDPMQSKSKHF